MNDKNWTTGMLFAALVLFTIVIAMIAGDALGEFVDVYLGIGK